MVRGADPSERILRAVGVLDIITGLAQAGAAVSGTIVARAAKAGTASILAQRLDGYAYRQLTGIGLFGQAASFVVTTKDILDQYDTAKAKWLGTYGEQLADRRSTERSSRTNVITGLRDDARAWAKAWAQAMDQQNKNNRAA